MFGQPGRSCLAMTKTVFIEIEQGISRQLKKEPKTFAFLRVLIGSPRQPPKVFCFFFSKKKFFLPF
jgi:hypothetical protein